MRTTINIVIVLLTISTSFAQVKRLRTIFPQETFSNYSFDTLYVQTLKEEQVQRLLIKKITDNAKQNARVSESLLITIEELSVEQANREEATQELRKAYKDYRLNAIANISAHEARANRYKKERNKGYYIGFGTTLAVIVVAILVN